MAGSRDAKEEIRQRVGIIDVVSEYVAVKRSGKSYKGLCPFHAEKTPSFTVSEEFQTWHCFGCGEHGDVFSFLMKVENLTFAEALERLAKRAGVELERFRDRQTSRRELLGRLNGLAAAYYTGLLKRTPTAIEYLHNRGLADQTIEQFRLGYAAPAWDGLVRYLTRKGADLKGAEQAGLVISGERGLYDRFRHRIIFPILDIQERVIGFGGRALGDEQLKYLNSPETALFSKTRSLYGLNLARKAISEKGYALIVEGYMDAITAHQAGFVNCVATLGTALTLQHINVLSRYTQKIALAYDADSAGMTAALRGAALFDEAGCDVRIVRLPGGDDPDSLLRKGRVSEFAAAVAEALAIVDYKLAILRERHDLTDPAGRAAMLKEAARVLAEVPSFIERERCIKELIGYHPNWDVGPTRAQNQIRADVEALIRRGQTGAARKRGPESAPKPAAALEGAEKSVLRVLICQEEGAETVLNTLTPEDFSSEMSRAAAKALFEMFEQKKGIYLPGLLEVVGEDVGAFLSQLAMSDEGPPTNEKALEDCTALIRNSRLKRLRTSEVLGPYMKQGIIDASDGPHEQTMEELKEFLEKSGKLPEDSGQ
ncbi:MAG TPA: DNA primase [Armatimonadota bacterium]|nr:DNA primase [Armatimonadota bacterium]